MLIISLVLAVIGLAALVFAVITSNELVAWVCIGASIVGVILLIVDAIQERRRREAGSAPDDSSVQEGDDDTVSDYPADDAEEADETSVHSDSEPADDSVGDEHHAH